MQGNTKVHNLRCRSSWKLLSHLKKPGTQTRVSHSLLLYYQCRSITLRSGGFFERSLFSKPQSMNLISFWRGLVSLTSGFWTVTVFHPLGLDVPKLLSLLRKVLPECLPDLSSVHRHEFTKWLTDTCVTRRRLFQAVVGGAANLSTAHIHLEVHLPPTPRPLARVTKPCELWWTFDFPFELQFQALWMYVNFLHIYHGRPLCILSNKSYMVALDDWGTPTGLVAAMEPRVSWHLMHIDRRCDELMRLWTSLLISGLCFCCRAQMCGSGSVGGVMPSSPQCCSRRRRSWECYEMARGSLSGRWISLRTSWTKR